MKTCYIFGSLDVSEFDFKINDEDIVIAADAGLKNTEKFKITPDYVVGDFDSLCYTPKGTNVIRHPVQKDETDTILAVDVGFEKGYKDFIILGCLGGRLDHTFASIQTAAYIAEKGGNAVLIDNETYLTVIKNNKICFTENNKGLISVFACSGRASGVSEQNLLYELNNAELTPDFPLGVSNEFIGKKSTISVEDGKICIIWNEKNGNWTIGG